MRARRAPKAPLLPLASRASAALFAAVVASSIACTEESPKQLCHPGDYSYCRCQDRQEGSKLCNDDGMSFGACEPCESFDDPEEDPFEPDDPRSPPDAGGAETSITRPASCGNGTVDPGEDCDDGNADFTDGCDSNCKLAGLEAPASSACPGLTVHLWGGAQKPSIVTKSSGSGFRSATPACAVGASTSGAAAPDRIFKVVPHASGTLTVATADADYDSFLYVAEACSGAANTYLACANQNGAGAGESISLPVSSGKAYYVFVDGAASGAEGTARVTFSLP